MKLLACRQEDGRLGSRHLPLSFVSPSQLGGTGLPTSDFPEVVHFL